MKKLMSLTLLSVLMSGCAVYEQGPPPGPVVVGSGCCYAYPAYGYPAYGYAAPSVSFYYGGRRGGYGHYGHGR